MDRSKWTPNDWENYLRGWQTERLADLGMRIEPLNMTARSLDLYWEGQANARSGRQA